MLPRAGPSRLAHGLARSIHTTAVARAGAPVRNNFGLRPDAAPRPRTSEDLDLRRRRRPTFGLRDSARDGEDSPRRTFRPRDDARDVEDGPRRTFRPRDSPDEYRPPRQTFGLRSARDDPPRDAESSFTPTPGPRRASFPSRPPRISQADAARAGAERARKWRSAPRDRRDSLLPRGTAPGADKTDTTAEWVGTAYTASPHPARPRGPREQDGAEPAAEGTTPVTPPSPAAAEKAKTRWNPTKKLTFPAMAGIRELHAQDPATFTREMLAEKFGVSWEAINRILKSNNWREKEAKKELGKWDRGADGGLGPVPMIREVFARAGAVKGKEKEEAGTGDKGGRGGNK
ncbi:Required for respiratory growth protein 9, mitochondrial [Vanrija pseudolonga]|uniref:Required for respiratory growth protein 9, mitochondrial n=1 Tax=Vanrija pseudolonga TaxID=143232 RepID=A0AAF1BL32_9TREE|nr:Required for respiratory growth protein 9, mitochondrial [Vanrija pseudolonga]